MRNATILQYPVDSFAAQAAARAVRTEGIVKWVAFGLRLALAAARRRLDADATYCALSRLDSRTLRDLGLDRSEIRSVANEVTHAGATRVHALAARRHLP